MTNDANAAIAERGQHGRCVIGRRLVDDDDFERRLPAGVIRCAASSPVERCDCASAR